MYYLLVRVCPGALHAQGDPTDGAPALPAPLLDRVVTFD